MQKCNNQTDGMNSKYQCKKAVSSLFNLSNKNQILILLISFVILSQLIVAQENISENQTEINASLNNFTKINVSDNQPPTLIINFPYGNIDSLTPEISISVNDSEGNLEKCWYDVKRASNGNIEISFGWISDCQKETIPEGFLQNNLKYIINVSVNDTYGNTFSSTASFITPQIKIPNTPNTIITNINNTNITNQSNTENKFFQLFINIKIWFKNLFGINV
ncbi:MAG: hypothetical protein AABY06_02495 [Nanoarchaeota archaeon]